MDPLALPPAFIARMQDQLGDDVETFIQALQSEVPVSIRYNPYKNSHPVIHESIDWCTNASYLKERPVFTLDPLFHAGTYYVQEASSMFIGFALKQVIDFTQDLIAIDLCAAPGGKSTHLLSLLNAGSTLFSNELISNRNSILRENITKWGCANTIVTQANANDYAESRLLADIVLVDAPCSGEGMFRKDKNAISEWNEENVATCSARQTEIVDAIKKCLREDGILVYSTCTYNELENDNIIEHLLSSDEFEKINLRDLPEGIASTKYGYQFYPHKIKGEGFYCSFLKYIGASNRNSKFSSIKPALNFKKHLNEYLSNANEFIPYEHKGELYAFPANTWLNFQLIKNKINIRQAGLHLGTIKGDLLIPSHNIALSNHCSPSIKRIELTKEQALHYLKGETIIIKSDYKGWCLATYEQLPLGWMKLIQGRMNNYYPKSSRIKMNITDYEG